MQPTLPTDRPHDLPPFWDGRAVLWDGWRAPDLTMFICPPPKPECCRACGTMARPVTNRGHVARWPAITHKQITDADDRSARLPHGLKHKINPLAYYELTAFRCPDCRHDTVLDHDGQLWDLDETDYHDEGSNP